MDGMLKPTLLLMTGRALGFAGTFLIPVVLARVFDPAAFGTYKQLFLVYTTLLLIVPFGMGESLFYFVPRSPEKAGRYAANSLLFLSAAGLSGLGLLEFFREPIAAWFNNPDLATHVAPIGAFLFLTVASTLLEVIMISRGRYREASWAYGGSDLVRAAALVVPALVWRSLEGVFLGAVAFGVLRLGATLAWLRRELGDDLRPDAAALWEQLGYAIPFGAAALLEILQGNVHQYAVAHRFDAATFALYSVGCLQIPLVEFLAGPAGNVLMVRMGERLAQGRSESCPALWQDTTRRLALVFVPMVALLVVTARDLIVLLFTVNYAASAPVFRVCSTTILLAALQTDAVLRVYAQTRFLLALNAVRLVLILVLVGPLLTSFGLPGAALVAVVASGAAKLAGLVRMKRLMGTSLGGLLPWRNLGAIGAAATTAAVPALVVSGQLDAPTIVRLVAAGGAYAAVYLWLVVRLGLLTEEETAWLGVGPRMAAVAADPTEAA